MWYSITEQRTRKNESNIPWLGAAIPIFNILALNSIYDEIIILAVEGLRVLNTLHSLIMVNNRYRKTHDRKGKAIIDNIFPSASTKVLSI